MSRKLIGAVAVACGLAASPVVAQDVSIPVLVPVTGVFAIEGGAQRNGALLAFRRAPQGMRVRGEVYDTAVAPDVGVQAFERAIARDKPTAVVTSMIGVQLLAMLPVGREAGLPMLTTSGTASVTEQGNPWIFRFFTADPLAKEAHVRYVLDTLKRRRIALIHQTTAYGQSGRAEIVDRLKRVGVDPVMVEALEVSVRDMSPTIGKVRAANPDVIMLHLHSQPTALFIRAAAQAALNLPIVAGSAIHQPTTAALLEPAELTNVCGEANASPVSAETPEMKSFLDAYRKEFNSDPDGFSVGQYDAVMMLLDVVSKGARTPADIQKALSTATYKGLGMTYKSDGKGNMAHTAVIVCYDGKSRIPRVAQRYENLSGVFGR